MDYDTRQAQVLELISAMGLTLDEAADMTKLPKGDMERIASGGATMGELVQLAKGVGVPLIMLWGDRYEALSPDWHK